MNVKVYLTPRSAWLFAGVAFAAPLASADPALEEIIVTAQKRTENLQSTPISLEAFKAETLEERGITNIGQLAAVVPNLRIVPFGVSPTTLRIYIRGVGVVDSQVTEDPPVGVYLNGVYVARPVGLSLDVAEIERIEVLRGPQGTLYGRNTTGGAINIITAKPNNQFGGSQLFSFGNYGAVHSQTALNVPVTDRLFVRGAFDWNRRDGWLKNTGGGPDFSGYDRWAGRFDVRWLPLDSLTVDYSFDRSESEYTPDYYHLTTPSPAFSFLPAQPHRLDSAALPHPLIESRDLALGHTLTLTVDTPIGEAKSISAYREVHSFAYQDYSGNPFLGVYRNNPFRLTQDQFSQEFQLVGATDSKTLEYIAGLYYFQERGLENAVDIVDLVPLPLPRKDLAYNKTYAAYGQATWHPDFLPDWSLTVGGRYTMDKRQADNFVSSRAEARSYNFSPTFVVNYQAMDNVSIYAKLASGYKSGGYNLRQASFAASFGPEKLTSYELGWKTEWLSRRLRWNTALFYEDYKDIQLDILVPNQPDPTLTVTRNAGKANVEGIETDLDAAVTDSLRAQISYAYLYNVIDEVQGDNASLWRLPNAPKHAVTATVDWDIANFSFGVLDAAVDFSWRSKSFTGARIRPGDDVMAYALTDLRISLSGDDWFRDGTSNRITAWVRNLADTEYFNDTFGSFSGLHATKVSTYGLPRTFGVDFKVKF